MKKTFILFFSILPTERFILQAVLLLLLFVSACSQKTAEEVPAREVPAREVPAEEEVIAAEEVPTAEEKVPAKEEPVEASPIPAVRCSAYTKAETQCKRNTRNTNGKCWQHQPEL